MISVYLLLDLRNPYPELALVTSHLHVGTINLVKLEIGSQLLKMLMAQVGPLRR